MRSMLVIGLGRFGKHLATRLMELKNEVMAVDTDESVVNAIAPFVTAAHIGDCMDPNVISSLGVNNFDVCFVCISESLQSSLEITSLLKDAGAKLVVAKTDSELHAKFLIKLGADSVVHPERDMAYRIAAKYSAKGVFDYIELSPEYAIFEMQTPDTWVGKSLMELGIRSRYNLNVIGVKVGEHVEPMLSAEHVFKADEHLLVAGGTDALMKLAGK